MKIKICETLEHIEEFESEIKNLRELYPMLCLQKDKEFADKIFTEKYKFILIPETGDPIALVPEVVLSEITGCKELVVIKDVEGEIDPATVSILLYSSFGLTLGSNAALFAVTAIINIAISMSLNMVMSLISPTKEFSSDPAAAQKTSSSLFNGAPLIREQGGGVPLAYGYGFCGGVLISSSLTTVDG